MVSKGSQGKADIELYEGFSRFCKFVTCSVFSLHEDSVGI